MPKSADLAAAGMMFAGAAVLLMLMAVNVGFGVVSTETVTWDVGLGLIALAWVVGVSSALWDIFADDGSPKHEAPPKRFSRDDFNELKERAKDTGAVYTLGAPKVAYKATKRGIATLIVPEGARLVFPHDTYKARTNVAYVERIEELDRTSGGLWGNIRYTGETRVSDVNGAVGGADEILYQVGDCVYEKNLSENTWKTCGRGINLFADKGRAEEFWLRHCA